MSELMSYGFAEADLDFFFAELKLETKCFYIFFFGKKVKNEMWSIFCVCFN